MSLLDTLVQPLPGGEKYPATAVIRELIRGIAQDVCAFRRNTQISYRVVEQFSALRNGIDTRIKKVETEDVWEAYDQYSQAIDPLEE